MMSAEQSDRPYVNHLAEKYGTGVAEDQMSPVVGCLGCAGEDEGHYAAPAEAHYHGRIAILDTDG